MVEWFAIRTYFNYNNSICSSVTSCRRDGTYRSESSVVSRLALWWLMLQVYSEISQVKVEYSLFWIASCTQFSDMALLSLFFFTEIDGIFK